MVPKKDSLPKFIKIFHFKYLYEKLDGISNFLELKKFAKMLVQTPLDIESTELYEAFYVCVLKNFLLHLF